ncbi:MAG: ABC transporter substrate-binding protein [Candidatus Fimenecus sp.]
MKMKKVLAVLLAVTMVALCFAACGNNNTADTGEKTIKIGFSGPLTGDYAQYGNGVKNGAQLAIDEINEAGGINGYKLELNPQDDEGDQEKAVNAYNTLKDWGMQLSLGTVTSGACIAFQGVAKNDNMFVLTPSASAVQAIEGDNAFRVCFSDPNQGIASADYIADNKLATKVAVIYQTNDYSTGIYNKFVAEAKEKGLEVVTAQSFTADNNKDFSAQIQAVKSSGAELLFLPIYYSEATLILQQAKNADLNVKFFGCDGLDGILTMENFDTSLAEGVMLLTPFAKDATDSYTVNFVAKYKEKYGEDTMNQFAADAYDAIYIIKAAAEKAGITPDMTASETCDALKAAMTQITVDGVTGTGITWSADGEPSKAPKAVVIENGAYKAL